MPKVESPKVDYEKAWKNLNVTLAMWLGKSDAILDKKGLDRHTLSVIQGSMIFIEATHTSED